MIVIGLTGGIGMGKSTVARFFKKAGLPVWDADQAVHDLYAPGGAGVDPIGQRFPDVITAEGGIDRQKLSQMVMGNAEKLSALEKIIHPLVAKNREDFLEEQRAGGADMALCDIPLLFETGGQGGVDIIVVVTAPEEVRKSRVLKRPQMTAEKYEAIRARQWPDEKRRAHADYLIHTDQDLSYTEAQVLRVLKDIREKKASLS